MRWNIWNITGLQQLLQHIIIRGGPIYDDNIIREKWIRKAEVWLTAGKLSRECSKSLYSPLGKPIYVLAWQQEEDLEHDTGEFEDWPALQGELATVT